MSALPTNALLHDMLSILEDEAFAKVTLNGTEAWVPAGSLITLYHCMSFSEHKAYLYIEFAHFEWMLAKLEQSSIFLDVGASTGAMSVPFAIKYPKVQIFAFEPAERARRLLDVTVQKNRIDNVEIIPAAVSRNDGSCVFIERGLDPTGATPFLPEGSTLYSADTPRVEGEEREVSTICLDTFAKARNWTGQQIVVKIDIEGYEALALEGAVEFIKSNVVHFAIDIHANPFGPGTTEAACREILSPLGYKFENESHVLLCQAERGQTDNGSRLGKVSRLFGLT